MPPRLTCCLVFFLGVSSLVRADGDPETGDMRRVVDHRKVKKYFLELYNEALAKAMKEQEEGYSESSERGLDFGFKNGNSFPASPSKFTKFGDFKSEGPSFGGSSYKENGFTGFNRNPVQSQIPHTLHRRGGHHHKHHHHKHSHEHTNDHKHAHKHLHEQSHEHKHSAKHQHVHKHEHHHEHNHHHKHKEDHEHKQDHKHSHKHLHAHKDNSWRRQGDEEEYMNRRQDNQHVEMNMEEEIFVPIGSQAQASTKKIASEYPDIEYDAWIQI